MKDFVFDIPTKIIFGKDAERSIGSCTAAYGKNALIIYGSERIRKNGLYDMIAEELSANHVDFTPFGGVEENPLLSKVRAGVAICKERHIDVLIAVGGGSVIDSAKAIALGACSDRDVWDFYEKPEDVQTALPIGVILTMAATASEANGVSVLRNAETNIKKTVSHPALRPAFALMDPKLTYSVPPKQTAEGSWDIFAHSFERYILKEQEGTLRDHMCEAVMKTVLTELPLTLENPDSYEHRSQLMWAATVSHSNMVGFEGDFACHALSHIFTGAFGIAHGGALAILMPAWCQYQSQKNPDEVSKIFKNVFKLDHIDTDLFRQLVRDSGLPATLSEAGFTGVDIEDLAARAIPDVDGTIGRGFCSLNRTDVKSIIELCV